MILDDGAGANQLTAEHGPLKTPFSDDGGGAGNQ